MSRRICRRSSFWSAIVKAWRTGLASPLIHVGANCLANGALRHGKKAGEARRTLMSSSPATHQYSTVALPMVSQHLPLLSRAGLSKPTHTHGRRTHTHAHTHAHTDGARHRTIRQLSSPSSSPVRALQALVPRKAWEMRGARPWRAVRVRTSDSDRPCWDSGGGRNPCQHALLRLPGLGSGTAIVRDSTPTSLLPAAQLPGHGSLDLTDLI